jgi:hypothetical protein
MLTTAPQLRLSCACSAGPRPRASWRLRKAPKVTWGRHSRPLFAKYRSDSARFPSRLRMASSSLRCAKRAPCPFTETAVKRAIRAVRAAGETPGRLVVTKDGFALELGEVSSLRCGAGPTTERATAVKEAQPLAAQAEAVANDWDELLR